MFSWVSFGYRIVLGWGGAASGAGLPRWRSIKSGSGTEPSESQFPHLSKRMVRAVTSWDFSSENFGLDDACKACIPHPDMGFPP